MGLHNSIVGGTDISELFSNVTLDREDGGPTTKPRTKTPRFIAWFVGLFFPNKKQLSLNDNWALKRKQNQYLFMFYVIIYLFFQYDGVITKKEYRLLHRLIRKSSGVLEKKHYQDLAAYSSKKIETRDLITYIETHELPDQFIKETLFEIKKMMKKQQQYKPIIRSLEKNILKKGELK